MKKVPWIDFRFLSNIAFKDVLTPGCFSKEWSHAHYYLTLFCFLNASIVLGMKTKCFNSPFQLIKPNPLCECFTQLFIICNFCVALDCLVIIESLFMSWFIVSVAVLPQALTKGGSTSASSMPPIPSFCTSLESPNTPLGNPHPLLLWGIPYHCSKGEYPLHLSWQLAWFRLHSGRVFWACTYVSLLQFPLYILFVLIWKEQFHIP